MSLKEHAEREMKIAGLLDEDSDYNGMVGEAVIQLADTLGKQGHSGFSAFMTIELFNKVARFENVTPLTSDPDEWNHVGPDMWQSSRNSKAFSTDAGANWYLLDD